MELRGRVKPRCIGQGESAYSLSLSGSHDQPIDSLRSLSFRIGVIGQQLTIRGGGLSDLKDDHPSFQILLAHQLRAGAGRH